MNKRQIKARFQKRHLSKLLDVLFSYKLGLKEGDNTPLLEFRKGVTREHIIEGLTLLEVEDISDMHLRAIVNRDGFKIKITILNHMTPKDLDIQIMRLMRYDRWFKDNSAIPIYI